MKPILPLLSLSVGIGVGYFLFGREAAHEERAAVQTEVATVRLVDNPRIPLMVETDAAREGAPALSEAWLMSLNAKNAIEQYTEIGEALAGLTRSDYPRIMDVLLKTKSQMGWKVLDVVRRQWAATDPRGMITYIDSLEAVNQQSLRRIVFNEWALVDFSQAWAEAIALPEGKMKEQMVRAVLGAGAQKNPLLVLNQLEAADLADHQSSWIYGQVFQALENENPEQARQMAAEMPPGDVKKSALVGSLHKLMNEDLGAALAWLDSLPVDSSVYRARKEVLRSLQSKDFETVRAFIEAETDPKKKQEYLENIQLQRGAQTASFDETLEMYEWMDSQATGQTRQNKMSGLIYALADSDLPRAINFALELPFGNTRMNALSAVGNQIAQKDLQSVIEFAESLPYEDERERVLSNMSYQVLRQGVESASAFVLENDQPELQRRVARQLVQEWAEYDREGALDWMAQLTDKEAFRNAQQELLKVWGRDDPQGTVRYIESEVEESKRGDAYRDVISNLAYQDPEAAIAWLNYLPEDGRRVEKDIYNRITNAYVNADSLAASEWVASLEKGDVRDASVKALVQNVVRFDPASAFIWANSVDGRSTRQDSQKRTIREWAKKDIGAAYQAVIDAQIEASEKEPLLQEIESERKRQSSGESGAISRQSPVMISIVN